VPLATLDDINKWLDRNKIELLEADVDEAEFQLTAERIIKGFLSGTFTSATLATWVSAASTPDLIQEIAGKLIAALYYRKRYAEDVPELDNYAQGLYNEALGMLSQVKTGEVTLIDLTEGTVVTPASRLNADDFFPNDAAGEPIFSMDLEFG
jgi:hypothetical protein